MAAGLQGSTCTGLSAGVAGLFSRLLADWVHLRGHWLQPHGETAAADVGDGGLGTRSIVPGNRGGGGATSPCRPMTDDEARRFIAAIREAGH